MFFRVDKRDLNVGAVATSANHFTGLNPPGSQEVEAVFEKVRPINKPTRSGNLFLFTDEVAAKRHWSKMTDGKLYRAIVDPTLMRHEGDMRLVNHAFELRADPEEVEKIAIRYWAGDLTKNPILEVIVPNATISQVVSKDQRERMAFLRSWAVVKLSCPADRFSLDGLEET